jgi:hypothetical protein
MSNRAAAFKAGILGLVERVVCLPAEIEVTLVTLDGEFLSRRRVPVVDAGTAGLVELAAKQSPQGISAVLRPGRRRKLFPAWVALSCGARSPQGLRTRRRILPPILPEAAGRADAVPWRSVTARDRERRPTQHKRPCISKRHAAGASLQAATRWARSTTIAKRKPLPAALPPGVRIQHAPGRSECSFKPAKGQTAPALRCCKATNP